MWEVHELVHTCAETRGRYNGVLYTLYIILLIRGLSLNLNLPW